MGMIVPEYCSDQSIVELTILIHKFSKGRGLWKLNTSLHKNKD